MIPPHKSEEDLKRLILSDSGRVEASIQSWWAEEPKAEAEWSVQATKKTKKYSDRGASSGRGRGSTRGGRGGDRGGRRAGTLLLLSLCSSLLSLVFVFTFLN